MRTTTIAGGLAVATLTTMFALAGAARADDKADLAALEKRVAAGIEAKDADAVMANYVSGDSLLVFDIIPPRQYAGSDAYKKDWAGVFSGCADSPKMEISDLEITADSKLAFSHSIQHFACTDAKGNKMDMTMRATDAYRKIKGKWLIVHEHYSAPIDLATGKADLTSKP
jgi:ketosteroid isomerase-like protein